MTPDAAAPASAEPVLCAQDLRYAWPGQPRPVIDIEHFAIGAGESVFLHGPSGCGKSTLLSLLAGVLRADAGQVRLLGRDWSQLRGAARDRQRVDHVGYIFQQFNLLPYLSVIDNVLLPCRFSTLRARKARRQGHEAEAARRLLSDMGIGSDLWTRQALQLSVGQQQRVAAARALIGEPELVIADEPTSALDEDRREAFLSVLLAACAAHRSALVFVSHDRRIADRFERHLLLPTINRAAEPAPAAPAASQGSPA